MHSHTVRALSHSNTFNACDPVFAETMHCPGGVLQRARVKLNEMWCGCAGIVAGGTVVAAHAAKNALQDFLMTMSASVRLLVCLV